MIDYSKFSIPKPPPRWKEKAKKKAAETRAEREIYAQVDRRDEYACRVCHKAVGGIGMLEAVHHHHIKYRSQGGLTETKNLLSLCVKCHGAVHNGEIRLSGDADQRNSVGNLSGVKLERGTAAGWVPYGWR